MHPTLYNGCNYLSMLGLKLNHVSKRGHRCPPPPLAAQKASIAELWLMLCCYLKQSTTSSLAGAKVMFSIHKKSGLGPLNIEDKRVIFSLWHKFCHHCTWKHSWTCMCYAIARHNAAYHITHEFCTSARQTIWKQKIKQQWNTFHCQWSILSEK